VFDKEYFNSEEFRELLSNYEESVAAGQPAFLDADDFVDIADYYNMQGETERANDTVDYALSLYPSATLLNVFKARRALERYDFDDARRYLSAIDDHDSPDYHYLKAEVLIAENRLDEADEYLRQYSLSVPADEHDDFIKDVINLYVDYDASEKAYQWVLRAHDDTSDDFMELMGRTLFGLGKYQDSQRVFNELIDRHPFSTVYWNALASAQFMDEDYPGAVTSSEYAIAIDPSDSEGLMTKACSLFRMGNFEQAADYFARYIKAVPDGDITYALLHQGVCMVNLNRSADALPLLQQALAVSAPDSELLPQIHEEMAFCYGALRKPDEAMAALDNTESLECDHVQTMVIRGHILLENGLPERAEHYFKQAMRQSNHDPSVIVRIIVSLYDNHLVKASYFMFKKLFSSSASSQLTDGFAYMALCCHDLGYADEFLHYLQVAVERNPQEAHQVLAPLFPDSMPVSEYVAFTKEMFRKYRQ